jgi:hypothetical protein
MMTCKQIKAADISAELPQRFDVFIVSASFEKRCFTVAQNVQNRPFDKVFVAGNINHLDYIGPNWDQLCTIFERKAVKIPLNSDKPIVSADRFIEAVSTFATDAKPTVLLDISTFTREALFILISILRKMGQHGSKITCIYNSATSYGWLSRGISDIRSVLGFPGNIIPSRKNHLIVLPGYEVERAVNLIATYEPNLLSIGYNRKEESVNPKFFDDQMKLIEQLCSVYSSSIVKQFEFSARDPFKTKSAILNHARSFTGFNTILSPLSTKLSSVGGCLACFENENIQLCYAQPGGYNIRNYAEPSQDVFVFDITL